MDFPLKDYSRNPFEVRCVVGPIGLEVPRAVAASRQVSREAPGLGFGVSTLAHMRQSRPDSGLGFQVKVLKIVHVVLSLLGSGQHVVGLGWLSEDRYSSQYKNNCFAEMRSGFEAGSYLRLIDFLYHSTLGWRVIKKKRRRIERVGLGRLSEDHARGEKPPQTG